MPPLMASGKIDGLAFIGGSKAADDLIRQHPNPHRLKLFLQLEAKNMAIFLPGIFSAAASANLDTAVDETVIGSLSYNGQRCTALKLIFVPKEQASKFVEKYVAKVEKLSVGLPWETDENGGASAITPLPNQKRVEYMKQLIDDAVAKGAKIMNKDGGKIIGGSDSTLMVPAVLYPVSKECAVYHEEQFGPVVPIVPYDDIETVLEYGREGDYGQQVAIFTSEDETETTANILDKFSSVFGKININNQCGRSPDSLPFSGRRSSALGIMSVSEALKEFSIPTVVTYKDRNNNAEIVQKVEQSSVFMEGL